MTKIAYFMIFLLCMGMNLPAQVLTPIPESESEQACPEDFPLGIYFMLSFPAGNWNQELGMGTVRQQLGQKGIEVPRLSILQSLSTVFRYQRLYLEVQYQGSSFGFARLFPDQIDDLAYAGLSTTSMQLGYALWRNRNNELIFRGGLGTAQSTIQVVKNQQTSFSFDQLGMSSVRNPWVPIFHNTNFVEASLEVWRGRPKNRANMGEALRIGYRQGLAFDEWQFAGATAIGAPRDRLSQLFFQVQIHFGTNFSKVGRK
ncbi:MAG: hypothetical protein AAF135_13805 [Bacteroidota bacterium]